MADAPGRSNDAQAEELKTRRAPLARVTGELLGMASWKKKLLALFLLIAAIGAVMRVPAWIDRDAAQPTVSEAPVAVDETGDAEPIAPPGAGTHSRGFIDGTRRPADEPIGGAPPVPDPSEPPAVEAESNASLPWTALVGEWMAKLGLSFAGGLVLGVFFRAFLKTMATITAIVMAGIVALSYFEIINVDFTTMKTNYDTYAGWLQEQGWRLKDLVTNVLPSAVFVGIGFFVGFVRR